MIQAVGGRCPCVVRTPWNDVVWIKRVLDTGCDGIVIPQIQTAAEAESAVRACRYPPAGIRGIGAARGQRYGMGLPDDVMSANAALTIVVQIEHIEAVKNVRDILAVPGIDAILIGPNDLSASMGLSGNTATRRSATRFRRPLRPVPSAASPWAFSLETRRRRVPTSTSAAHSSS